MLRTILRKGLSPIVRLIGSTLVRPGMLSIQSLHPAPLGYVQPPPRNAESLPPEFRALFGEFVAGTEKLVYKLTKVGVSWNGVVQRGLAVFGPSLPYAQAATEFSAAYSLRQWVGNAVVKLEGEVGLVYDYWSVNNYYHWLIDALPRLLLLREVAPGCTLLMPSPLPDYISLTAKALGFSTFHLIPKLAFTRGADLLMPGHTAPVGRQDGTLVRAVRRELIQTLVPKATVTSGQRIYVSRSRQKNRRLLNEEELLPLLTQHGFRIVYFEEMSLEQQIGLMQHTEIFIGVHGANMTNMLFLPEGATVVELMSTSGANLCYFNLASNLGLAYHVVPCSAVEGSADLLNNNDVIVDLKKVIITLAEMSSNS